MDPDMYVNQQVVVEQIRRMETKEIFKFDSFHDFQTRTHTLNKRHVVNVSRSGFSEITKESLRPG